MQLLYNLVSGLIILCVRQRDCGLIIKFFDVSVCIVIMFLFEIHSCAAHLCEVIACMGNESRGDVCLTVESVLFTYYSYIKLCVYLTYAVYSVCFLYSVYFHADC